MFRTLCLTAAAAALLAAPALAPALAASHEQTAPPELPTAQQILDTPVEARQSVMEAIGAQMKVLGQMAKGETAFDAEAARAAVARMDEAAHHIEPAFEPEAMSEDSEARPDIWMDWESFTAQAEALREALAGVDVSTQDGLKTALGTIGGACKDCHEDFREKKS